MSSQQKKKDTASVSKDNTTNPSPVEKPVAALEEDDEFEEFVAEDWNENAEDINDMNQWEDNWDDDDTEDDFSKQLRAELMAKK